MEDGNGSAEIKTPLGSLSFSGKKTAEFITILTLCVLFALGYAFWEHKAEAASHQTALNQTLRELTRVQRELVAAQRELTCMLATPEDRREKEFYSPNSLCKQLARER